MSRPSVNAVPFGKALEKLQAVLRAGWRSPAPAHRTEKQPIAERNALS